MLTFCYFVKRQWLRRCSRNKTIFNRKYLFFHRVAHNIFCFSRGRKFIRIFKLGVRIRVNYGLNVCKRKIPKMLIWTTGVRRTGETCCCPPTPLIFVFQGEGRSCETRHVNSCELGTKYLCNLFIDFPLGGAGQTYVVCRYRQE